MTYPQEVFMAFSFLGFLASTIPLPWHLEAWNTGTCLYMMWTGLSCLNYFINAVIWRDDAFSRAQVWCEISTRFNASFTIALPAASLCINRRLFHIASVSSVRKSNAEKRRDILIDLAIGLGIPIVFQVFYYINQGHRYDVYEQIGCLPFIFPTWVTQLLYNTPPLIIGIFSAYYAIRSIITLNKSRNQFNEFLSGNSNLNSSRYFRLMILAGVEVLFTIPLCIVILVSNSRRLRPWKSWADTHMKFDRVDLMPAMIWRANPTLEFGIELGRWATVFCALLFFAFFGFADEARNHYRMAINSITKTLGISSFSSSSTDVLSSDPVFKPTKNGSFGKIRPGVPVEVHKELYNRGSIVSMNVSFNDAGGLLVDEKDDGKSSTFAPTLSYGAMTLNDAGGTLSDVGGTLPDYSEYPTSVPSSGTASTLSPTPALTRHNSTQNIEISSLRRDSTAPDVDAEKAHTPNIV